MALFKTTTVKENKREKGIALIFTLIMLSLLLILALSFALDSMFEQKAAYNSANASSAELMNQSQLQEVLSLVSNEATNLSKATWSCDLDYGYNTSPDPMYTDSLKERIEVAGLLDANNNKTAWDSVNWNYIKNPADNNRIIGRTAFVIIPDEKIPLPSLVDARPDAPTDPYPKHDEQLDTETRIGKYVSEINIRNAVPKAVAAHSSSEIDDLAFYSNWTQSGSIGFSNARYDGAWESFDNLYTTIEKSPSSFTFSSNDKDEFQTNLTITRTEEAEAFWSDTNADEKIDNGELYRRFDLTRSDWDKKTWDEDLVFLRKEILMLNTDSGDRTSQTIYHEMQQWQDTDTDATATSGFPWFAAWGYNKSGVLIDKTALGRFDSVYDQRCQIAANLKDYCDDDMNAAGNRVDSDGDDIIRPTSDVDPATWASGSSIPKFTGNEKTPYINKIAIQIEASAKKDTTGSPTNFWAQIKITPHVELINIFKQEFTETFRKKLKVRIIGKIKVKVDDLQSMRMVDNKYIDFDQTGDIANSWDFSGGKGYNFLTIPAKTENVPNGTDDSFFECTAPPADPSIEIEIKEVIVTKVVLYNGNDNIGYDYVKEMEPGGSLSTTFFTGNTSSSSSYCWYGWAVHDPRQNLNSGDWLKLGYTQTNDPTQILSLELNTSTTPNFYEGKPNSENSTYGNGDNTTSPQNSISYLDKELGNDPADGKLSTAFIRNAPIQSPWELGFIQRGYMWQTINLKKYDYNKGYKPATIAGKYYIPGGGEYTSGDANILDQIKMTHGATSPQKINLNSTASAGFHALLSKIRYGCDSYIDNNMSVKSLAGIDPATGVTVSGTSELAPPSYPLSGTSNVEIITKSIIAKYKDTVNPERRKTRASVVDELLLPRADLTTAPITADTDAKQEELIGKVVNLTKMGNQSGHFTIIAISQTIKDVGGVSPNVIKLTKYPADGTAAVTRDCTIGTFDFDQSKNIYFDEITATKKIIFKGRVSGANKIKVIGIQYAD